MFWVIKFYFLNILNKKPENKEHTYVLCLDSFIKAFFQHNGDIVKDTHGGTVRISSQKEVPQGSNSNSTFITLISKVEGAMEPSKFRPISLMVLFIRSMLKFWQTNQGMLCL